MLGIKTEKFVGIIDRVEKPTAYVQLSDKIGDKSYMEIPIEDLEESGILCKAGVVFRLIFKRWRGWEKIVMSPVAKKNLTVKDLKDLNEQIKEWQTKYKDV